MNPTITPSPNNPAHVRLSWDGFAGIVSAQGGRCYVDFDGCPVRGLTPTEAARDWARRVLGVEVP